MLKEQRHATTINQYELVPLDAPPLPVTRIAGGQNVRQSRRVVNEDAEARISAAQQLLALGHPLPEGRR